MQTTFVIYWLYDQHREARIFEGIHRCNSTKITFYGQMVWSGTHDRFFNFGIPVSFEWIKIGIGLVYKHFVFIFIDQPFRALDDE